MIDAFIQRECSRGPSSEGGVMVWPLHILGGGGIAGVRQVTNVITEARSECVILDQAMIPRQSGGDKADAMY